MGEQYRQRFIVPADVTLDRAGLGFLETAIDGYQIKGSDQTKALKFAHGINDERGYAMAVTLFTASPSNVHAEVYVHGSFDQKVVDDAVGAIAARLHIKPVGKPEKIQPRT
jgi:hypothetical protein